MGEAVPEGHPDAALLALEKQWNTAHTAANEPRIIIPDDKGGDAELHRRDGVADALALRMSELPAHTLAGVRAKLRWVHHFQRVHGQLESPIERCQEVCIRTALAGLVRVAGRARRNGAFGDATAVRCSSSAMRAYCAGDILYVSATKPVVQGRNVLVELRDYSE